MAIQRLPVRFAMDRAGLVGADGATHAGSFDLAYLGCLPGMVLMAPSDEAELVHMVATAAAIDDRPSARALPARRGRWGRRCRLAGEVLPLGRGRVLREGGSRGDPVARHAARRCVAGGRRAGGARLAGDGRGRALRQAVRHGAGRAAGAAPCGADHDRGGRGRRVRLGGVAASGLEGAAGRRAPGAADGAARPLHRPRHPAEAARRRPASPRRTSSPPPWRRWGSAVSGRRRRSCDDASASPAVLVCPGGLSRDSRRRSSRGDRRSRTGRPDRRSARWSAESHEGRR